jgi:3D (Asp-Asp-Asp) domain-containing protein
MKRAIIIIFCISLFCILVLGVKIVDGFNRLQVLEKKTKMLEQKLKEIEGSKITVIATAYTSSRKECDDTPFITASGKRVFWGVIAADPKFPFGTKIYIPFFKKTFIVLDRGGAIKGNRIDIWMANRKDAIKFGKRKLIAYVLGR